MTKLKYTVATLALLCASGLAYAQESTPAQPLPEVQNKAECPAPGSVPEASIPAECQKKEGVSSTEAPLKNDSLATGTTEVPKTDDTAAVGSPPAPDSSAPAVDSTDTGTATVAPPDAILASQFMGQSVYTSIDENVGEISDLIMNKDLDNIVAIVGVGGFLGIGEKDVAIPIDDIKVVKDANNALRLTISTTKQQLEALPVFDRTAMN